ncbi:MAG: YwiC-like family protein [Chloroflexi bacterium]|nr:YwiC-like family protein [Chloroflexota bacterium]
MPVVSAKSIRSVALPAEHGAWSLWLEPALLAMLVAPSTPGIPFVLISFCFLLLHQPLRIVLIDVNRGKRYDRTRLAAVFLVLYIAIAGMVLLGIIAQVDTSVFIPLMPAFIAAIVVVWYYDLRGNSRDWLPEVLGAVIMSTFATSMALAGGWTWPASLALSVIAAARSVSAVFYVRARLCQIKYGRDEFRAVIASYILFLCTLVILYLLRLAPFLALLALASLAARAIMELRRATILGAKVLGVQEVLLGLVYVFVVAAGFIFGV